MTVISRSSTKTFTKVSFMRAETFQSIVRMSSPGWYGRTSRNASPCPLKLDLYVPDSCSFASRAVWISIVRRAARSSRGSRCAAPARRARGSRPSSRLGRREGPHPTAPTESRHLDDLEDAADDLLGRHLLRVGLVREHHAVAEHVGPDRLHVLGRHVAAVAEERVRARRQVQRDRRARARRRTRSAARGP